MQVDGGSAGDAAAAAADGSGGGNGNDAAASMLATVQEELRLVREQLENASRQAGQQRPLSPSSNSPPSELGQLLRMMQETAAATEERARKQHVGLLTIQSMRPLATFNGKGADTTLIAHDWLQTAELHFATRESAMGNSAAEGDAARVQGAIAAMEDDAARWYRSLPLAQRPSTWAGFCTALKTLLAAEARVTCSTSTDRRSASGSRNNAARVRWQLLLLPPPSLPPPPPRTPSCLAGCSSCIIACFAQTTGQQLISMPGAAW